MITESKNTDHPIDCKPAGNGNGLSCKLTTPEFQKRKKTIIANLKEQVTNKKELEDGYAFAFKGSDEMLDSLIGFIKTERACCDFFAFTLSVSGNKNETRLEISGPAGAKDFISTELGL